MNLKNKFQSKKEERFYFDKPTMPLELSNCLYQWIPKYYSEIVILCIGTDRSTGDSLGPLTGSLLLEKKYDNFIVYGTLSEPVHAMNLRDKLDEINKLHKNPYIIAIDACLGKINSIGSIITAEGPVQPGKALNKDLPSVGDIHISGVVNVSGYMEFFVLQNTRLHIVMQMAKKISASLTQLDRKLTMQKKSSSIKKVT